MPSSKREREAARRRYERRQAQRQYKRSRTRRRNAVIGAAVATVLVVGGVVALGIALSDSGKKSSATPAASLSATPTRSLAPGTCSYEPVPPAQKGGAKNVGLPDDTADTKTPYVATITTNVGTIKVDLLTSKAPCTVNSFKFLASKKYFDGTTCHRLTTAGIFVLQCGDPTGTGGGGPGYQFADENLAGATYPAGTVAMANAGAGTNGSQFFLVYKDTQLPASYTPFGKIVSGLDVVTKVAQAGTDNATGQGDGHPKTKVTIKSFTVSPA